jgi:hypothetical protein
VKLPVQPPAKLARGSIALPVGNAQALARKARAELRSSIMAWVRLRAGYPMIS